MRQPAMLTNDEVVQGWKGSDKNHLFWRAIEFITATEQQQSTAILDPLLWPEHYRT